MTGEVVTWGGDAMPDGVRMSAAPAGATLLSRYGAEKLTREIRGHLTLGAVKLAIAREGEAHLALGYATWHEYCEAEFGDLRELRLPVPERRALVESMRTAKLPIRAIAGKLGVSLDTVHRDLPSTRERTADVVPIRPVVEPDPIGHLPRTDQVVILIGRQGDRGMTCRELELETGWHHGICSATLSAVARQGRVLKTDRKRLRYGVYVDNPDVA